MKISIVTPSFQQDEYLERTMRSVFDQNDDNLQYVVVDGGSSDNSASIIRRYDDRLAWSVSEGDGGQGNAINKGFARTDGEIMAWLNSDDMYFPWTFRVVREVFEAFPEIEWITGIPALWNSSDQLIETYKGDAYINKWDYVGGRYQWIQQESTFWRRSLWDRTGGRIDESGLLMIDGELWTRFFVHAQLWRVETLLGGYRLHGTNRAQANLARVENEMNGFCRKLRDRLDWSERDTLNDYLRQREGGCSDTLTHSCNCYPVVQWDMTLNAWAKTAVFRCHDWPFFPKAPASSVEDIGKKHEISG